jgi:DNA-binding FadR family transcriptional regulator
MKRLHLSVNDHMSINKFHRKILEGLKGRDAEKVGDLMNTHLADVKQRLKI